MLLRFTEEHAIRVFFADEEVPVSPIKVQVAPSHDASRVWVEGPGLFSEGDSCYAVTDLTVVSLLL